MLKNKNVLITGSTSGIGLAIAEGFAYQNANLIINGITPESNCSSILQELSNKTNGRVLYIQSDLTQVNQIQSMIEKSISELGSVDILINNACIQHVSPIEEFPDDKWDQIIALGLSSAFHTSKLCLPKMREKQWGRIINIASAHGIVASVNKAAYVSAKHGAIGLTKVIALETAEENITCNAICPGWVLTPLVDNQIKANAKKNGWTYEQATQELLREKQPSMKFVKPEDIAQMCLFLCSESANQITGSKFIVDGGWTAR